MTERVPLGNARELAQTAETLPLKELPNKVVYVNEDFQKKGLPFGIREKGITRKIQLGDSIPTIGFLQNAADSIHTSKKAEVESQHKRSAIYGRVIFTDGIQIYRDIDLKGVGYYGFDKNLGSSNVLMIKTSGNSVLGLLRKETALHDAEIGERFIEAGIKTDRTVVITSIDSIVKPDGQVISVSELKDQGIIPEDFEPVIIMRAYGVRSRVHEVTVPFERRKVQLLDAKRFVQQQLNVEELSWNEYLQWFSGTLGLNVARMHNIGLVHLNLHADNCFPHNITLDCRIIDKDGVQSINEDIFDLLGRKVPVEKALTRDTAQSKIVIYELYKEIIKMIPESNSENIDIRLLLQIFIDTYEQERGVK